MSRGIDQALSFARVSWSGLSRARDYLEVSCDYAVALSLAPGRGGDQGDC